MRVFLFAVVLGETGHTMTVNARRDRKLPRKSDPLLLLLHIPHPVAGGRSLQNLGQRGFS